jgi:hypothetical protein
MTLERLSKSHKRKLTHGVDVLPLRFVILRLRVHAPHGVKVELCPDVSGRGGKDNSYVAMSGLDTERWTEDTEEVEVGEVIDLPFGVDAVWGECSSAGWEGDTAAKNDGVEAAGRGIVNPFCGEGADGV